MIRGEIVRDQVWRKVGRRLIVTSLCGVLQLLGMGVSALVVYKNDIIVQSGFRAGRSQLGGQE